MFRKVLFFMTLSMMLAVQCTRDMAVDNEPTERTDDVPSIMRHSFSGASIPAPLLHDESQGRTWGRLDRYNPYGQYPVKYIRPNREFPSTVTQTQNILVLEFTPDSAVQPPTKSWAGVMQHLDKEPSPFVKRQFLEIMLNVGTLDAQGKYGVDGVLHIDFGRISEDVIPNGKLDTEDKSGNGRLDAGEDVGLDGMANDDPRAKNAGGDFWDINGDGVKNDDEPYSDDDWAYNPFEMTKDGIDYSHINGTENNKNDAYGGRPDSEDLNGNGALDTENDYFSFALHLSPEHEDFNKYVVYKSIKESTGEDFGWRLYRIPFDGWIEVGSPDRNDIETMRLWLDGFEEPARIAIASIESVEKD